MAKSTRPPRPSARQQFQQILDRALVEADQVDCPIETYIEELTSWTEEISMRIGAAKNDVERAAEAKANDAGEES